MPDRPFHEHIPKGHGGPVWTRAAAMGARHVPRDFASPDPCRWWENCSQCHGPRGKTDTPVLNSRGEPCPCRCHS